MIEPYRLLAPEVSQNHVIFASPHSGRAYPPSFVERSILNEHDIRSSEDAYVDLLFDDAPKYGSPLLLANLPRAYVDLNRDADELDPAVIDGVRPRGHNPRISSGLGVIPRVVANGRPIYSGKLPMHLAYRRILDYWHPYHVCLSNLIQSARAEYGQSLLIDCHSMPGEALTNTLRRDVIKPDIVLGDLFGSSASIAVVESVKRAFEQAGFRVARNTPFAGAYNMQRYGRPSQNQHAIQVEIDRRLYLYEDKLTLKDDFAHVKKALNQAIDSLALMGRSHYPLAAE